MNPEAIFSELPPPRGGGIQRGWPIDEAVEASSISGLKGGQGAKAHGNRNRRALKGRKEVSEEVAPLRRTGTTALDFMPSFSRGILTG